MNNNVASTWGDLSDEQRDFYMEFHAQIVNNVHVMPQNNDPVPLRWGGGLPPQPHPSVSQINAVCDTGDRLCRTINYRLTEGQHNAIVAYITRFLPNHPDPVLPYIDHDIHIQ